jgi:hypothetical protein
VPGLEPFHVATVRYEICFPYVQTIAMLAPSGEIDG